MPLTFIPVCEYCGLPINSSIRPPNPTQTTSFLVHDECYVHHIKHLAVCVEKARPAEPKLLHTHTFRLFDKTFKLDVTQI